MLQKTFSFQPEEPEESKAGGQEEEEEPAAKQANAATGNIRNVHHFYVSLVHHAILIFTSSILLTKMLVFCGAYYVKMTLGG